MKSAMGGVRSIDSLAEYRKFLTHCPLFRLAIEDIADLFEPESLGYLLFVNVSNLSTVFPI